MRHQRITSSTPAVQKAERAILFQLLRDDHAECWERPELEEELSDVPPADFAAGLDRLKEQRIAQLSKGHVWATCCARYLDSLGVISV
jgi:hypothetical protein